MIFFLFSFALINLIEGNMDRCGKLFLKNDLYCQCLQFKFIFIYRKKIMRRINRIQIKLSNNEPCSCKLKLQNLN